MLFGAAAAALSTISAGAADAHVAMVTPGVMNVTGDLPASLHGGQDITINDNLPLTIKPGGFFQLQVGTVEPGGASGDSGASGGSGDSGASGGSGDSGATGNSTTTWATIASTAIHYKTFHLHWTVPSADDGSQLLLRFYVERKGKELIQSQTFMVSVSGTLSKRRG